MAGKLILILGLLAVLVVGANKLTNSLPNLSLPSIEGSQTNTVDLSKVTAAFASAQGLSAGETLLEGINVTQNKRSIKQIPGWIAGSCSTLENGKAKVTYHSDTKSAPPTVIQTATGIAISLGDPTVRSVGITEFDSKAINTNQWCGLVVKQFPDVQAMNRVIQKSACDWAKNDTSQLESRRADAKATALALISAVGVATPVDVQFRPVPATLPAECNGLDK